MMRPEVLVCLLPVAKNIALSCDEVHFSLFHLLHALLTIFSISAMSTWTDVNYNMDAPQNVDKNGDALL